MRPQDRHQCKTMPEIVNFWDLHASSFTRTMENNEGGHMQTFMPYSNIRDSVQCLDRQRLGKQRLEAMTIYKTVTGQSKAWFMHPAVRMWRGHHAALAVYYNAVIDEWTARGYKNNMPKLPVGDFVPWPAWIGDDRFHASHRSNLLRKAPDHYGQFGWLEDQTQDYYWPIADVCSKYSNHKWVERR